METLRTVLTTLVTMHTRICLLCLLALGCGSSTPPGTSTGGAKPTGPPKGTRAASSMFHAGGAPRAVAPDGPVPNATAALGDPLPADLRTRTAGEDWPGFLGPTADGKSTEKGIIAPWPEEGLRIVWQRRLSEGYAMPSISRGRLFMFDRAGDNARLTCLNSETGEELWSFEYPTAFTDNYGYNGGPRCCPVVDGDRVYIFGPEGMLHCLKAADGKLVWKLDTAKEFGVIDRFFGAGSTPVIEGDLLLVQVGGSPAGSESVATTALKPNGTALVAFDKYNGSVRYKVGDDLASCASPVLATINGRRWCLLFARSGLIGLEPAAGKIDFHFRWRAPALESVNAADPVVVGDCVFISETYGPGSALLKIKPGACEVLWSDSGNNRDKAMQCHWMTPIHTAGYLYGCSGRHPDNAELRCIELATGKVMWSVPDLKRTSLLRVDGHFICLSEDGVVRLLKVNPMKYEEVSKMTLSGLRSPCWAAPILAHGLLYLRGRDRLLCLELIPGKS
jgi:outer membrane protein assembly factor BamB